MTLMITKEIFLIFLQTYKIWQIWAFANFAIVVLKMNLLWEYFYYDIYYVIKLGIYIHYIFTDMWPILLQWFMALTWHVCEKEGCKNSHFLKNDMYVKHWNKFQEKSIVYDCSMVGCMIQSTETSRMFTHRKKCHKQLNKYNTLAINIEPNMFYKSTGGCNVQVNIAAREACRKERQRYIMDHPVNFHV